VVEGGYTDLRHPFANRGFENLASDIGGFPLSLAVAASAGVPGILGPTVLKDRSDPQVDAFEQLGDGGLYDNYGLESLVQLFATILEERPGLRARIIVVDASSFFAAQRDRPDYTVADYADRVTSIAWLRASDYTDLLYKSLNRIDPDELEPHGGAERAVITTEPGRSRQSPFRNLRLELISLYHQSDPAKLKAEAARAPEQSSTLARVYRSLVPEPIRDPTGFVTKLNHEVHAIGVRFSISDEAADLVDAQAELAVGDAYRESAERPNRH
jgi:predicted acylesterase/phospholipase RssA